MGRRYCQRRPVCRLLLPKGSAKGNNPCRACRRLLIYLTTIHEHRPAQPPRILRPVRCLDTRR